MADVVTTVKVRNADGTYSEELPIGTTADHVTVPADGSFLSDVLGDVNVTLKKSLQQQIDELRQALVELTTRVENLENK